MKYKILLGIVCLGLFLNTGLSQSSDSYYFYSNEDLKQIKASSETSWGRQILDSLRSIVSERLKHSLEVPVTEGGHLHHYFCPVHNLMFTFDWDKPFSHYCKACKKYWENNDKYNWAWIHILHGKNLEFMNACRYLYLATGESKYANYIKNMLLDYASKYPAYKVHDTERKPTTYASGKMFGQSLDESVWASDAARDYVAALTVMTRDEKTKIENGYLRECANLLLNRRLGANWQMWHNSGLTALGIALKNDSILQVALNDPQIGYHKMMAANVYSDGWWNEGSPIYHFYTLRAILLTADAVRCRNINLFDEQLHSMLTSPVKSVYNNLVFPAHNDGWYGESLVAQVKLYETAYTHFKDPLFLNVLRRCYVETQRNSPEALLNSMEMKPDKNALKLKSSLFKDAGYAVLHSKTKTVVFKYGPHGGGHGHPDKLSVSIHDGKNEILPDLATSAYGVPDFQLWYRTTLSHNTVTADKKDQTPSTGKLIDAQLSDNGGTVEAEANDAYKGVKMNRKISLKKNTLSDIFTCTSDSVHTYDYVLILTEKPVLPGTGTDTVFKSDKAYDRIHDVKKFSGTGTLKFTSHGSKVSITVPSSAKFDIFLGEASGIPPTNPGMVTKTGSEKRPVQSCYPLIIRTVSKDLKINANWDLK